MDFTNISLQFYQFSKAFPKAAMKSYQTVSSLTQSVSSLSPKAKQNLSKLTSYGYRMTKKVYTSSVLVYSYLMEQSLTKLFEWDEPNWLILYPLSLMICFILPVKSFECNLDKNMAYLFLSNKSWYSFDTLPLLCKLYLQTGIWPRVAADAYNFKIPIWRQLIEYFGAFQDSKQTIDKMLALNYSVLAYPGGLNETLRSSNTNNMEDSSVYSLSWNPNYLSQMESYPQSLQVIPISIIGMNDMLQSFYDVDISPILWWMGYKDSKATLPLVYPSSYQRLYMNLGSPISLNQVKTTSSNPSNMVSKGIHDLLCIRDMDEHRYLLTRVGWILGKVNQMSWVLLDKINFKSLAKAGGVKLYEWGVSLLESC